MFTSKDVETALDDARRFAENGEYEQALERQVWYHENALKYAPDHFGVRLSFALCDWAELGEAYPRALDALRSARDEALATFRKVPDDSLAFLEVMSMNLALDDLISAKALFYEGREHEVTTPVLASEIDRILDVGDTEWARDVIGKPEVRLEEIRRNWESTQAEMKSNLDLKTHQASLEEFYAGRIATLVKAIAKTQGLQKAREVQREGLRIIDSPAIREAVNES